jgi:radical SAM protein with 4Fe4S-binding SPASM domain
MKQVCIGQKSLCEPVVDITPDFKATSCFGTYTEIDCSIFKNLYELQNYLFLEIMNKKRLLNYDDKCIQCKKFQYAICQGGCLAFSKLNE